MRAADHATIADRGVPGLALMETAGIACARVARSMLQDPGHPVVVVAGPGNNGGDGWVIARHLHQAGVGVGVVELPGARSPDAETMRAAAMACGVACLQSVGTPGLVVDALLGTGLTRDVQGAAAGLVDQINASGARVLAVDQPSGVCADTGRILGCAVRADVTVTFGHPRLGQLLEPAVDHVGRLVVAEIGLVDPPQPPTAWIRSPGDLASLATRRAGEHKASRGRVAVVAGSLEMAGAAVLACSGALFAGCGLVTLFTPADALVRLGSLPPEVMVRPLAEPTPADLAGFDAVVVGPGRGRDRDAHSALLWRELTRPAVFDADALDVARGPVHGPRVITPHPGEAGRMLGRSSAEVQADRAGAAAELGRSVVCVLKGRHTLIAQGERLEICLAGGPMLATGGTGDVLAGMIGAGLARGGDPYTWAARCVLWHAIAGEFVGQGLTASTLARSLSECLKSPRERVERPERVSLLHL
jgi:NAD(P)H-hydrate epimerase